MPDFLKIRLTRRGLVAILVVLAAATSASRARGQTLPAVPLDSIERSFAEANGLPSLVVGVSVGGERTVVGVGDVGGAAPDARTIYEIGSVSKVLTSLALADGAPVPHWTEPTAGAGAWRSTASDLLTLVEAALVPTATPLADALALSLQVHGEATRERQMGLGWMHGVLNGRPAVWHNGMVGGSAAFVAAVPEAGVAVVVLTNRQASVDALDALGAEVLGRAVALR